MGYTGWSASYYDSKSAMRSSAGVSGSSSLKTKAIRSGAEEEKVDDELNPFGVIREAKDSDQNPESTAIAVLFDVTGSMGRIPAVFQEKLGQVMSLLLRKGYVTDPQIMFGAIGDATCDLVPLQIGQYESGGEMDDQLDKVYLEGGGGGECTESYELGLYFMANNVKMDCWEKRGKKGYLFTIGDEMPYNLIKKSEVDKLIGKGLQEDLPIEEVIEDVKRKYEWFHLVPTNAYRGRLPQVQQKWRTLCGQNMILLDNEDNVAEVIVSAIAMCEGYDLSSVQGDLSKEGVKSTALSTVNSALSSYRGGAVSKNTTGELEISPGGVERL